MLLFIYSDTFVEGDDLAACSSPSPFTGKETLASKLLAVADKYRLDRLRMMCESYMCKDITIDSVSHILSLADRYHALDLKALCLKFAAENLAGAYFF